MNRVSVDRSAAATESLGPSWNKRRVRARQLLVAALARLAEERLPPTMDAICRVTRELDAEQKGLAPSTLSRGRNPELAAMINVAAAAFDYSKSRDRHRPAKDREVVALKRELAEMESILLNNMLEMGKLHSELLQVKLDLALERKK